MTATLRWLICKMPLVHRNAAGFFGERTSIGPTHSLNAQDDLGGVTEANNLTWSCENRLGV